MDFDLPPPNYHRHFTGGGYGIGWEIDGYFGTLKGKEYLNDTIARFLITFQDHNPKRLSYRPDEKRSEKILKHVYKLKDISSKLESIATKREAPQRAESFADFVFWAIKLYAEDEIRRYGVLYLERVEAWALLMFLEDKERSTIKAKCRSVVNYYEARNYELNEYKRKLTDEEYLMTRQENMKIINERKRIKSEENIRAAVEILKRTGKKINVSSVARESGISRPTVYKYKHIWEV